MNNHISLLFILLMLSNQSFATQYQLPSNHSRLIGENVNHTVEKGDYFQALSEHYNVGFLALMAANPGIDPFLLSIGTTVIIPKQMLLPYSKREGIVINLAELRLYYFSELGTVDVFPIGIGQQGLSTPNLISFISDKRKDPPWRPTEAMKERYFLEHGKKMMDVIPAGPDNPFGKYALRIGHSEYLIHGTNQRFGIGMRSSSGCIRMFADDIEWLFNHVEVDTLVRIVDQPIKMSYESPGNKMIEVHSALSINNVAQKTIVTESVRKFVGNNEKYWQQLEPILSQPHGLVIKLNE